MVCFCTSIYYITLMAWSFSFLFNSFRPQLPWLSASKETGDNVWNQEYFHDSVLQKSDGIH